MNEQIVDELLKQSRTEYWSQYTPSYDYKKFAELIVEECASICYKSNLADSDAHAQNLLYEFNIDNARNQK